MDDNWCHKKRDIFIFSGIGFLFFFLGITQHDLAVQGNIIWTWKYVLRLMLASLGCGALLGCLVCFFARKGMLSAKRQKNASPSKRKKQKTDRGKGLPFGILSGSLIWLCWLPCYLAYYPGICAYDFTIQTGQVVSASYNDHHPLAHTLLIAGSMKFGETFLGDANTGIAILVFAQMTALAAAFAWGITLLRKKGASKGCLMCLQLFCMIYPFHMYMSVSVIKDVFFSIFFFVQLLALCEMINRQNSRLDGMDFLFFSGCVGMQLFRTNGKYALYVFIIALAPIVIFGKKNRRFWGKVMLNCLVAVLAGSMLLSGLFSVTKAQQGDRREMLSMPIQQLARCMLYHGGVGILPEDDATMEEQSRALLNDFILDEGYAEYDAAISDPVKRHANTYVVRYRSMEFVRTYFDLLAKYPGDFINAALLVNAGYFYPQDVSHALVNQNGRDKGLGYVQTRWVEEELNPRGIYKDSKWKGLHERMEDWADENAYLHIPLLKFLFVPGVFWWLYLLLAACLVMRGKYGMCVPLLLVFGYYLTLFLGPVVQLRYIYPLMILLPFMTCLSFVGKPEGRECKEQTNGENKIWGDKGA